MRRFTILIAILLPAFLSVAVAQDYRNSKGYFDLSEFDSLFDTEPELEVDLHGILLGMASGMTSLGDPELAEVLDGLDYIHVKKYKIAGQVEDAVKKKIDELSKKLDQKSWQKLVVVREKNEKVSLYVMPKDTKLVEGVVVMSVEPQNELVLVNIVGEIDPVKVGKVGQKWDIQDLDSLRKNLKF